ncbi:uncharacterized protein ACA1_158030 [Acanthamoeba castellanii str. Neff]|uniref:Doublecortin domain-containing protein n=1 Tax=Acanthamoeba castellanii (strain ATCC 30010 / Neff) TaxID=1257118 RepID=L8H983_ACACF|nr:uncharacterized protein ACA1_158030 [Acanthamoeba castellanii str. Neff]ELR22059.1 hypothetical protein ACA1_158030 [Acanthamoeba castellanii str. Neff]
MTSHSLSNFNKAPIQKFGTQATAPPKVKIFRCGEKHDKGYVFHKHVAEKLSLLPAVRALYTVEGRKIGSLEEIEDKQVLVAVKTGTTFTKDRLPLAIQPPAPVE